MELAHLYKTLYIDFLITSQSTSLMNLLNERKLSKQEKTKYSSCKICPHKITFPDLNSASLELPWLDVGLLFITFLKKFLLLFNYSCMPFLPIPPPHPSRTHLPPPPPPFPPFLPCVLHSSSYNPLSPLSPPHSPLTIVRLFLTSMSLIIIYNSQVLEAT